MNINSIDNIGNQKSRTSLYNLELIGKGSKYSESLTSYLVRMAEAHCLSFGKLFNCILAPALNKDYINRSIKFGGNRFFDNAHSLNGVNSNAYNMVKVLEKLTSNSDLIDSTLYKWRGVISNKGLFNKNLYWCPFCLNDFQNKYHTFYYPLLWYLEPVSCCTEHNIYLVNKCPSCSKEIPILHRSLVNGFCPYCKNNLTQIDSYPGFKRNKKEEESFYTESLGGFISGAHTYPVLKREVIKEKLVSLIDEYIKKGYRQKDLGFPKVTIHEWKTGKSIPQLLKLLELCYLFGISFKDFFYSGNLSVVPKVKNPQDVTLKRRELNYSQLEIILEAYLELEQPISMEESSKKIGINKRLLYNKMPFICKQISARYSSHINQKKQANRIRLEKVIKEVIVELVQKEVPITRRNIELFLNSNQLLRGEFERKIYLKCLNIQK
ncbi:TniQ family protein [Metabacillus sp. KIGAM252]|uniref:TniQ family protein n=1 Tax=Metabacillus flavus TaxID=2823519 RepID=A0ABS5LIH6_9BACI|nr:TniQ family protein [Metabacillus flavus]MBS2970532.1 TniQ family protein [Metabacillus flavus]